MPLSLPAREGLGLAAVVLLVVAVTTVAHLASVAQITLGAAAEEGRLFARQLFHQSARTLADAPTPAAPLLRQEPSVRALLEGMVGYSRVVVYAAIVDPTGRALVHSDPSLEGTTLRELQSLDGLLERGPLRLVVSLLGEPQIYETQLPIRQGDRPFGAVRVGISTSLVRLSIREALVRSLALGAVALVVALAVGLGAGRVLLESLRQIARRVERLARRTADARVELSQSDTLGELAERVNRLGERIQSDRPSSWPLDGTPSKGEPAPADGALGRLEDAVILLNAQREVIFCNQAAERLLGVRSADLLGHPLAIRLPEGHALTGVEAALYEGGPGTRRQPLKIPGPDGQPRELAVSSYRLREGGEAGGAVLVLQDLEPVRAVESLVTYAQKLAALGRLTSGLAHEVKNPLNAMRIHLELLKTRLPEPGDPVTDNLEVIGHEIQRLDRVVQGFLKFMRPQDLRLAPVDLNAILSDVARLTGPEAGGGNVAIVLDLLRGLPPVTGDVELLQQACTNLVTNAIQAMPAGGTLTLATRLARAGGVEVRVQDRGVGIAPEDLEHIFRLYYTTKENGSGIGLSLVYRIIQLHDGRIDVESTLGEGTTMILTLPLAPGPTES